MNRKSELDIERDAKRLFSSAVEEAVSAPPYLKSRVLAHLEANRKHQKKLLLWRSLSIALFMVLLLSASLFTLNHNEETVFVAAVNRPIAVKIEIAAIMNQHPDGLEIELPEGVSFYSESMAQLAEERSLSLKIDQRFAGGKLPIVVRADSQGMKQIKIRFFDAEKQVIHEKILKIDFKEEDFS